MLKRLFQFIKRNNIDDRRDYKDKSNSEIIYDGLTNELESKHKNKHFKYIIKRTKSLKWSFDVPDRIIIYVAEESIKGRRSSDIAKDILSHIPSVSLKEAESLSLTISSIQTTQITRIRAEDVGLEWYSWCTSEDQRVRDSHKLMDRVLVNWNTPPNPEQLVGEEFVGYYHAGECEGCRCYPAPLTGIDRVKWPCIVFQDGKITKMTKAQFKKLLPREE